MENPPIKETSSILSSLFSKKALTIGALAAGSAALLLGGVLYYQFDSEQKYIEELRRDIYSIEQVTEYLEDELYQTYPILLDLCQWIPLFNAQLEKKFAGQRLTREQLIQFTLQTITSPGNPFY